MNLKRSEDEDYRESEVVEDIKKMFDTGRFEIPVTDVISTHCGIHRDVEIRICSMENSIDLPTLVKFINFYLEKKSKDGG